ncbi:MAG: YheC/YheD family protein [Hydrogenibacillus sp.]|nr:YheC/YheD family protein [Hydrogenibacillus sp.]
MLLARRLSIIVDETLPEASIALHPRHRQALSARHLPRAMTFGLLPPKPLSRLLFDARIAPGRLAVSPELAASLLLCSELTFHAFVQRETLRLGPLVALALDAGALDVERSPDADGRTFFGRELCRALRRYGGQCIVAARDALSPERPDVIAWALNGERWTYGRWPAPDVIIPRFAYRREEREAVRSGWYEGWRARGAIIFNTRYLSKWEVFQTLLKTPLADHLPPTALLDPVCLSHDLPRLLKAECGAWFIKPAYGREGRGIWHLKRDGEAFIVRRPNPSGSPFVERLTPDALRHRMRAQAARRRLILQPDIELARIGDRPVDFRAVVAQTSPSAFRVASLVGRLGERGHFLTNLSQRGTLVPAYDALTVLQQTVNVPPISALKRLSLEAARALDAGRKLPEPYLELGIDLGVDRQGRLWIVEINGKPSKRHGTAGTDDVRPSVRAMAKATVTWWVHRIRDDPE